MSKSKLSDDKCHLILSDIGKTAHSGISYLQEMETFHPLITTTYVRKSTEFNEKCGNLNNAINKELDKLYTQFQKECVDPFSTADKILECTVKFDDDHPLIAEPIFRSKLLLRELQQKELAEALDEGASEGGEGGGSLKSRTTESDQLYM